MRRGRVFKRCSKCGSPTGTRDSATERERETYTKHTARCEGRTATWAYQVDVSPQGAPRKQKIKGGFRTKDKAVEEMAEVQKAYGDNTYVEPTKMTLARYLEDQWLPAMHGKVRSLNLRASTFSTYEMHVRVYLVPRLGAIPLQAVTLKHVEGLYSDLMDKGGARGPLKPKSIHNLHLSLHKALADAVAAQLLQRNPADKANKRPSGGPEMKAWSPEELRAFLHYVADDRLFAMWRLLSTTGMRRGEVLGLRWRDVDLPRTRLTIVQTRIKGPNGPEYGKVKAGKGRTLGLDEPTVAALKVHRARQLEERMLWGARWNDADLMFTRAGDPTNTADEGGLPIDPDVVSQTFERRSRDSGLPRIRLHDVRHSYATACLIGGVPVKIVSERLGHASVAITLDIYSHVLPGMDQEAAEHVAGVIDG